MQRFYFARFCGARCESADAATLRTERLELELRSTFEAAFATDALVLRVVAITLFSLPVLLPSNIFH